MRRNPVARRVSRRLFPVDHPQVERVEVPVQPIGAKLELTFACNLRCGFCYTDSPRHTLARTPELDDARWSAIVDEVVDVGVLEAVVTGGEPLLRRDLAFDVMERLDAAGVALYLNTNGWFVDDATADRLAQLRGLHVYVSIDGAGAARHDQLRGVPGSWKRAIGAASKLLDRGVPTRITHVVTPENRPEVDDALRTFARLGVPSTHLAPVTPIGAAADGGDWLVDRISLFELRDVARRTLGGMNVEVRGSEGEAFAPLFQPPATFLLRPDGVVRIASSVPFSYGHVDEGLAACWDRIRDGWNSDEVTSWLHAVRTRGRLARSDVVPYLDADAPVDGDAAGAPGGRSSPRPQPSALSREDPLATIPAARDHVTDLALSRRYRLGDVRWLEGDGGGRYVRELQAGTIARLNTTASAVMAACDGGTAGDAVAALAAAHPGMPREALVDDALAAIRMLLAKRFVVPALMADVARIVPDANPEAALTA